MIDPYTEMACCTECGKVRSHNEDAVKVDNGAGFCILADGMGGTDAGELASSTLVERIVECLHRSSPELTPEEQFASVREEIGAVDEWLQKLSEQKGFRNGCGTTLVMFLRDFWHPGKAVCLNIGDSRLYRYRDENLECMTVDHTIASEAGISESSLPPIYHGMLTRAVGFGLPYGPDRFDLQLKKDDLYILCSDGLTKVFDDKQLRGLVNFLRDHSVENIARILVSCVLDCGAPDNVSVAVVRVGELPPDDMKPGRAALLRNQKAREAWKGKITCR